MQRIILAFIAGLVPVMDSGTPVAAAVWTDSVADTFGESVPALDLTGLSAEFQPGVFVLTLSFTTANTTELTALSGWTDIDSDNDSETGRPSHIDDLGGDPISPFGGDYSILFIPEEDALLLYLTPEGDEIVIGSFPITVEDNTVAVTLPRCSSGPETGICIGARFRLTALLGGSEPSDQAPNASPPLTAEPVLGDFDEDGDVDSLDLDHLRDCRSGAHVPISPACIDADLDADGDGDQDDFGLFQRNYTGAF